LLLTTTDPDKSRRPAPPFAFTVIPVLKVPEMLEAVTKVTVAVGATGGRLTTRLPPTVNGPVTMTVEKEAAGGKDTVRVDAASSVTVPKVAATPAATFTVPPVT